MEVAGMTDEEAYKQFRAVRFADNKGDPFCPHCGSLGVYEYRCRQELKCKGCFKRFSVTTGTIFHGRKMPMRHLLMAIAIFVNGANGHAALRLSRDMCISYKTAFVLAHKLREVCGGLKKKDKLTGTVEIDGLYVGGHIRQKNYKKDRKDRRRRPFRSPERTQVIVNLRERRRGGRTLSCVCRNEVDAIQFVLDNVAETAKVRTDKGTSWGTPFAAYFRDYKAVNHDVAFSMNGVHVNWVESFHSRIRRAERGVHNRISGKLVQNYADELGWREDHCRVDNGAQYNILMRASARHPRSQRWQGYWRKRGPKETPKLIGSA